MNGFQYYMPTKVFFGTGCILEHQDAMKDLGNKAMVVTGKHSAKKNGSLADVEQALNALGKEWIVFDEIEENPSVETVVKGGKLAAENGISFVIGIGGGSPMDSAKAISVLGKNQGMDTQEALFGREKMEHLPVVEIPTTAGTGSETTQFSIVTLHQQRTKASIAPKIFAEVSFLDAHYMETLSPVTTNNTAVDALTHLIEAYMAKKANFFSDRMAEMGLTVFQGCMDALKKREYSLEIREKLMLASTIAGITIAQAGTSLPHALGYHLTYEKKIPHGRANGILTKAYLETFPTQEKVKVLLSFLGFKDLTELGDFLDAVLETTEEVTLEESKKYAKQAFSNKAKLASYPYDLTEEDLVTIYQKSFAK